MWEKATITEINKYWNICMPFYSLQQHFIRKYVCVCVFVFEYIFSLMFPALQLAFNRSVVNNKKKSAATVETLER
jgi:hypothetical protein